MIAGGGGVKEEVGSMIVGVVLWVCRKRSTFVRLHGDGFGSWSV